MANISQINGKTIATISQVDGRAKTVISQVDGQTIVNKSVTFSSAFTVSAASGTTTFSGTVTIVGASAIFKAFATFFTAPLTVDTSITINGNTRTANRTTVGTTESTTFTLAPGTYNYNGSVTISNGAGIRFGSGGISFTQP